MLQIRFIRLVFLVKLKELIGEQNVRSIQHGHTITIFSHKTCWLRVKTPSLYCTTARTTLIK